MTLRPLLVALLAGCTALASAAHAQQPTPEPTEADLIRQGVAAREQGRDRDAVELFQQAWQRYRTPRSQAQLALAYQALGRWGDADEKLRAALAATNDPWIGNNRAALEQALAVVGQHVGSLEVMSNVAGPELWVDGRQVGKLPLAAPLRLTAGTVVVQVKAEGYTPVQRSVTVLPAQLTREIFDLVALAPVAAAPVVTAPAPPPPFVSAPAVVEPPPSPLQSRRLFVGAAVATVVVTGLAVWSGLDTLSAKDDYETAPTKAGYDDGVKRERRTNVLIAGAAVLGVATASLGLFVTRW